MRLASIDTHHLCRKTKIKANSTSAQRMPPSPSKTDENRANSFNNVRNNCHRKRYNQCKENRLFQNEVFASRLINGDDCGCRQAMYKMRPVMIKVIGPIIQLNIGNPLKFGYNIPPMIR
jgi:hypothetical protein